MKRILLGGVLLGLAAVLGGCPIYPSQSEYQVCSVNACYSCPDPSFSTACTPWPCGSDSDCPSAYVCDPNQGACVGASSGSGSDGGSTGTDCTSTGCPSGQVCKLAGGVASCVTLGGGSDASSGTDASSTDSGTGGDGSTTTGDAASGDGNTTVTGPCNDDATCGGNGEKCIDGQCTVPGELCSDGSQCVVTGSACVDGVCEAHCSASSSCPNGTQCDLIRGVCNIKAACTGSGTAGCQGGNTCVEGACVPPCATSDAGPACANGEICVNGGCVWDQKATFACSNDGQSGQLATTCPDGSICLHHDCYTACGGDGAATCTSSSSVAGVCKNVTIETGTYAVCGSANTLGSDCDLAQGKACSGGKVCVDGYCQ